MLARHVVLLTPSVSLRLSELPCYKPNEQSDFHSPYTLPSSVSCKSFACHSYENCRVCTNNSHSGTHPPTFKRFNVQTIPRSIPFLFTLLRTLLPFFALSCIRTKLNPFLFNRFHTLCPKTRGAGGTPYFLASRNGNALPAAMGAAAKRAHRLQERRSLQANESVIRRRRRRSRHRRQGRQKSPPVALLDGVVRRHRKQRRRWLRPLNVRQCIRRIAKPGI